MFSQLRLSPGQAHSLHSRWTRRPLLPTAKSDSIVLLAALETAGHSTLTLFPAHPSTPTRPLGWSFPAPLGATQSRSLTQATACPTGVARPLLFSPPSRGGLTRGKNWGLRPNQKVRAEKHSRDQPGKLRPREAVTEPGWCGHLGLSSAHGAGMRELWDGLPGSHAWSHRLEAERPPEPRSELPRPGEGFESGQART